eukprot:EG_transcript_27026
MPVPRSALLFSEVRRRSLSRSSFGPGSCEGFRLLPNCILAPVPTTATGYMCDGPDLSPAPEDSTPCDVDSDAPPSDHTSEVDAVAKELFADPPSATAGAPLPSKLFIGVSEEPPVGPREGVSHWLLGLPIHLLSWCASVVSGLTRKRPRPWL